MKALAVVVALAVLGLQLAAPGAPAQNDAPSSCDTEMFRTFADPLVGPTCSLLVPFSGPDYLGNLSLAIGSDVFWQLPLPESLPAMTLHFQDWVLHAADNRFYGTARLTVPLVK